METNKCRICSSVNNTEEYVLKEMMFGTREEFEYFKCLNCGCLQIKQIPSNLEKYYPSDYLIFTEPGESVLRKFMRFKREIYLLGGKGMIGKILTRIFGIPNGYLWLNGLNLKSDNSILEVGCGNGDLLVKMHKAGFKNLVGVDPFIKKEIIYSENFKILKRSLQELNNLSFDLIMFHHSFEHLDDPHETFDSLKKLLKKSGTVLIRIPVIDSYSWKYYKTNWVQLDPPRHLFNYSIKSIEILAAKYGFKISEVIYDSTGFQFIGSEQYRKDIPLMSSKSYFQDAKKSIFTNDQIKSFDAKAVELNNRKEGDTACIFLKISE